MNLRRFWAINMVGWAIGTTIAVTVAALLPAPPLLAMLLGGVGSLTGIIVAALLQFRAWDRQHRTSR